jgi:hypothetical protein
MARGCRFFVLEERLAVELEAVVAALEPVAERQALAPEPVVKEQPRLAAQPAPD